MKPLQVYIEEDQFKGLKIEAVERGISVSELIRQCIISVLSTRKSSTNPPKVIAKTPEEDVVVLKDDEELMELAGLASKCKHENMNKKTRICNDCGGYVDA